MCVCKECQWFMPDPVDSGHGGCAKGVDKFAFSYTQYARKNSDQEACEFFKAKTNEELQFHSMLFKDHYVEFGFGKFDSNKGMYEFIEVNERKYFPVDDCAVAKLEFFDHLGYYIKCMVCKHDVIEKWPNREDAKAVYNMLTSEGIRCPSCRRTLVKEYDDINE